MTAANHRRSFGEGASVLQVEDLSLNMGALKLLDRVSFSIPRGEIVLLRGENGQGKTSLLNVLSGHISPMSGMIRFACTSPGARFHFNGRTAGPFAAATGFSPHRVNRLGVARGWQDIRLFPRHSAAENIALASGRERASAMLSQILFPGRSRQAARSALSAASRSLEALGLGHRALAPSEQLSLGESKRVSLLRATASGARLLLLDEPLSGLDAAGVGALLAMVRVLNEGDDPISFLIVEHDSQLAPLKALNPRVLRLDSGRMQEIPEGITPDNHRASGLSIFRGDEPVQRSALSAGAELIRQRRGATPMFEMRDLILARGGRNLLASSDGEMERPLSLQVGVGDRVEIHAPNGWGKTTLMETVAGFESMPQGELTLRNRPLNKLPSWQRARAGIHYVATEQNLFLAMTVGEMLSFTNSAQSPLMGLLAAIPASRRVAALSGGERQRLALTCAVAQRPRLLLLDEPLSMLDEQGVKMFRDWVAAAPDTAILACIPQPPHAVPVVEDTNHHAPILPESRL